jgi:hypothetical protein
MAILSAFYSISQRNFGILLILWWSFKLWWNFCLDQNFSYKGKGPLHSNMLVLLVMFKVKSFPFLRWLPRVFEFTIHYSIQETPVSSLYMTWKRNLLDTLTMLSWTLQFATFVLKICCHGNSMLRIKLKICLSGHFKNYLRWIFLKLCIKDNTCIMIFFIIQYRPEAEGHYIIIFNTCIMILKFYFVVIFWLILTFRNIIIVLLQTLW